MTMPDKLSVLFAEDDTLFRLMEMALLRRLTPQGEKALTYFFGPEFGEHADRLTYISERLGMPADVEVITAQDEAEFDAALGLHDVVILETTSMPASRSEASAPRARHIQQFGTVARHIDLEAARRLGLSVANLQRISSLSCADNIVALVLALAHSIIPAHNSVLAQRDTSLPGTFATDPPRNKFNWARIRDIRVVAEHAIGFIGMGENAGMAARRLRAMGMEVLYHKRTKLSAADEEQLGGVTYVSREELLARSDFVTVHIPYTPETEKYVDGDFMAGMKQGAYIINTSRGGILDEVALHDNLKSGHLAGAALDVYRYEPVPADCQLLDLENIIWTPHISGGRPEFMIRESEDVLTNVARVLNGENPQGQLSPEPD
ncbi:MAG: NAD(P)-dependent oxidoreductase [Rhodospirillales bacterium]|nr:NAD(P)-dependent oxidoreductase [Rhodospirillales bacterium]